MEGISIKTREIGCDQIYITGIVEQPNTDVETSCFEMYRMVEEILTKHNLGIFHERVFGNLSFDDTI